MHACTVTVNRCLYRMKFVQATSTQSNVRRTSRRVLSVSTCPSAAVHAAERSKLPVALAGNRQLLPTCHVQRFETALWHVVLQLLLNALKCKKVSNPDDTKCIHVPLRGKNVQNVVECRCALHLHAMSPPLPSVSSFRPCHSLFSLLPRFQSKL